MINIKSKINEYISQTSVVNPYAIIEYETDEGKVTFERRTEVMPQPAKEVLPHPADMDLLTLKKAIINYMNQKTTLQGVLSASFQKMSSEKAKAIIFKAVAEIKPVDKYTDDERSEVIKKSADKYTDAELNEVIKICRQTDFHQANTDHLSPIGEEILTAGMTSEYTIVTNKEAAVAAESADTPAKNQIQRPQITVKILKPTLTAYSSRTCVVHNRPTVIECGIAYGGDIPSFKLYRFANKIPLLYDEGSDVAREVVSKVPINRMGITKQEAKEFANGEAKSDRAVELLPLHIFFHICSTKIPYKTAGKESIAAEGELEKYMKSCLSELYRKVSTQIRKEMRMKEAASRLNLYKFYIPLVVSAISESIKVDSAKLEQAFTELAEKHVKIEQLAGAPPAAEKEDRITSERLEEEVEEAIEIDGEVIKPDREQIAINAARKKGKLSKLKVRKEKTPEILKEDKQVSLDTVIDKSSKGRKKVNADN